jgi:hypothetical protein
VGCSRGQFQGLDMSWIWPPSPTRPLEGGGSFERPHEWLRAAPPAARAGWAALLCSGETLARRRVRHRVQMLCACCRRRRRRIGAQPGPVQRHCALRGGEEWPAPAPGRRRQNKNGTKTEQEPDKDRTETGGKRSENGPGTVSWMA